MTIHKRTTTARNVTAGAVLTILCIIASGGAYGIVGEVDPDAEISYSGDIISTTGYTTLFTNRNLADYDVKSTYFKYPNGCDGYSYLIGPQGLGLPECCTRGVTAGGAERLRVLMQRYQSATLFSVELELVQQGSDIVGKVLSSRYVAGSRNFQGIDVQKLYSTQAVLKNSTKIVSQQNTANPSQGIQGYGINQLTMVRRIPAHTVVYDGSCPSDIEIAAGTLLCVSNCSQSIGQLSGGGSVIFGLDGDVNSVYGGYLSASEVVVAANRRLSQVEDISGSLRALLKDVYTTSPGKTETAKAYKLEAADSTWYRCQFQCLINKKICCVRVKLKQSGSDIVAKTDYAYWVAQADGADPSCGLGHDFYRSSATAANVVANGTSWGFSLSNVRLKFKNEVVVTAANSITNSAFMFVDGASDGSATNTVRITDLGGLPTNGTVTVGPYGVLDLDVSGAPVHDYGISSASAKLVVQTNGVLKISKPNMFAPSQSQRVRLYGGAINYGGGSTDIRYANNVMFADGARIYGARPRIGFSTTRPVWMVTGNAPSVCDTGAIFMDYVGGSEDTVFQLYVEDVTLDSTADLIWNGPMSLWPDSSAYDDVGVCKMGEGTVLQNGVSGLKCATEIWRGSWVFGASGISENAQEFRLEGDTTLELAAGVSNGLGKVTVNAPATLKFGEGSLLTLDRIEVTENATLTIDGELTDATLRVAETVSASQLALMRCSDGERVAQNANGYITRRKPTGFRLLLK